MSGKFATRMLVLEFTLGVAHKKRPKTVGDTLKKVLFSVLGDHIKCGPGLTVHFYLNSSCNLFEFKEEILKELRRYRVLKGMKLRIGLGPSPFEI